MSFQWYQIDFDFLFKLYFGFKLDQDKKEIIDYKEIELPFFSTSMGSVEQLDNLNYLVSAGSLQSDSGLCAVEISENGSVKWELKLKNAPKKLYCYVIYEKKL